MCSSRCAHAPHSRTCEQQTQALTHMGCDVRACWQTNFARTSSHMTDWRIHVSPLLTPIFRAWWRIRRPATLGVRALINDETGRVLLVRHTYAKGWHLPGGGVENG